MAENIAESLNVLTLAYIFISKRGVSHGKIFSVVDILQRPLLADVHPPLLRGRLLLRRVIYANVGQDGRRVALGALADLLAQGF